MRAFTVTKIIAGHPVDVTKLIDIMIIVGLTALMLFHFAVVPSMSA